MMKIKIVLFATLIAILQGCATLSKSECREADWRIIGLEDGSAGRPLSYIGRHRKSCAEHGVKPDIGDYQLGHADGVALFCTPRKAFELGKRGGSHNDVCPAGLRDAFLLAYEDGLAIYSARREMTDAQNRVKTAQTDYDDTSGRIAELEAQLVSGGGSNEARQTWLDELKRLQDEQEQLEMDIRNLEQQALDREREFNYINSQYQY